MYFNVQFALAGNTIEDQTHLPADRTRKQAYSNHVTKYSDNSIQIAVVKEDIYIRHEMLPQTFSGNINIFLEGFRKYLMPYIN